jgi:predicted nucleic acid-binding protein
LFPKTAIRVKALYFDTSYLFRLYCAEPGHEKVKALLPGIDKIFSVQLARAEFASIVLRKRREKAASDNALTELHEQFLDEVRDGHIQLIVPEDSEFEVIEAVLRTAPSDTFLRAADALHLASAAWHGFKEVYSNDRHFLAAAPLFGLRGIDVASVR